MIEILVVMAISVILMGLILGPVVKSFQLTRSAQAMVESQDAARSTMQLISRDLGQAMYAYDNASFDVPSFADSTLSLPPGKTPIMLPVSQPGGTTQWFVLPYAKIDFILPKLYMHCNNPDHPSDKPRDYTRDLDMGGGQIDMRDWPPCPYCKSNDVEARPKLPLEQDTTIVRYFLAVRYNNIGGLLDPSDPSSINHGWVSPWGTNVVEGTENQVVLYRVEFSIYDDSLFPKDMPVDERLEDPYFFYRTNTDSNGVPIWQHWRDISRVIGVGKYEDLVLGTFDSGGNCTAVEPTITFRTTAIENDPFVPTYSTDTTNDYPNAAPLIFSAKYGYWTPDNRVDVYRGNLDAETLDYFSGPGPNNQGLVVWRHPQSGDDTVEFNISQYMQDGYVPADTSTKHMEMAFTINENKGTVNFSLQPPRPGHLTTGPVCKISPTQINAQFHGDYSNDRGSAVRWYLLNTFDQTGHPDQYLQNAKVVPGSDRVIGPDMTPGPNYGKPIRYQRVPLSLGDPGLNQYKVDCDLGKIYFSSDPNIDLPEVLDSRGKITPILIDYKVHFNKSDDTVTGNYATKSLITVHLGMRMFDPDAGRAYPVDLNDNIKIRNALR